MRVWQIPGDADTTSLPAAQAQEYPSHLGLLFSLAQYQDREALGSLFQTRPGSAGAQGKGKHIYT